MLAMGNNREVIEVTKVNELCNKRNVKFSNAYNIVLALNSEGNVFAWGEYYYLWAMIWIRDGELRQEIDRESDYYKPEVIMNDVIDICSGSSHSLVLNRDGEVFAFGWNDYG